MRRSDAWLQQGLRMEVPFGYQGSRRCFNLPLSDVLLDSLLAELKNFDKKAFICVEGTSGNASDEVASGGYLLQRWSYKWGAYVVVASADEVKCGDRMTAFWSAKCKLIVLQFIIASEYVGILPCTWGV